MSKVKDAFREIMQASYEMRELKPFYSETLPAEEVLRDVARVFPQVEWAIENALSQYEAEREVERLQDMLQESENEIMDLRTSIKALDSKIAFLEEGLEIAHTQPKLY